jgi:tetratricopeptide (TPR) repeat protein
MTARDDKADDGFVFNAPEFRILAAVVAALALGAIWLLDEGLPGPGGGQRFFERGAAAYKEKKYDAALEAFDRAVSINPEFHAAYFMRAVVHRRRGEDDAAIADYTSAIRIKPDDPDAYYNRALIRLDHGDPERALADFGEFAQRKPDDPDGHLRRAEIFAALGDFDHALAERDALVRSTPQDVAAYLGRATLRRDVGDLDGALRDVDAAIAIAPADVIARTRHGLLWRDKGDFAHALADFDQAIALRPPNPDGYSIPDLRPELARGAALRDSGQIDAARAAFDAIIKRAPAYAPAYEQRGLLALLVLGDAKGAAEDFAAAVNKGREHRYGSEILDAGIATINHQPIPTASQPMLAIDVPFYPAIDYLLIWRHVARLRAGMPDPDFATDLRRVGLGATAGKDFAGIPVRTDIRRRATWPYHLVALFTEQTTPAIVLAAAAATPGELARRLRVCEAEFFVAQYRLVRNDDAEARKLLQAALDDCPAGAPEAAFARAELQRVNAPSSP